MNNLQELLYNNGERIIPYVSHDQMELIRHRSSYAFFHKIISIDLLNDLLPEQTNVSIVDLGFGTGYGCSLLSRISNSKVTGVDIAPECEAFARHYYPCFNVDYVLEDLQTYIAHMSSFDYVVSHDVLKYIPDGLKLIQDVRFKQRIMIDLPYKELPGNEHHVLIGVTEADFVSLENCEVFYEDLHGNIYDSTSFPPDAHMIIAVISDPSLPKIKDIIEFPIAGVVSDELEQQSLNARHYLDSPEELLEAVEKQVKETEVAVDIGCGIVPMNYFRPKLHVMVDPWKEYTDILIRRHAGDKSVLIFQLGALEFLKGLTDNSVDSIFLLDVIEHIEKEEGFQIIKECERVAREQVVLFTPLGFFPQTIGEGEKDGWGLSGGPVQEHLSGWMPEDFPKEWSFYICETFHRVDHHNTALEEPFGAFFAIRNFNGKILPCSTPISDLRRPLPSELALVEAQRQLGETQTQLQQTQVQLQQTQVQLQQTQDNLDALNGRLPVRCLKKTKRLLNNLV